MMSDEHTVLGYVLRTYLLYRVLIPVYSTVMVNKNSRVISFVTDMGVTPVLSKLIDG